MDAEVERGTTVDQLKRDLKVLAADMEHLRKATTGRTERQVAQMRDRTVESLKAAKANMVELQDAALARARAVGRSTDDYVHANPWQVMAVCALAGLAAGFLFGRGRDTDS